MWYNLLTHFNHPEHLITVKVIICVFIPTGLSHFGAVQPSFFVGLGFELRVSWLQSRYSTTWAVFLVHFAMAILEMGGWVGVLRTICPSWPWTVILLMSASQVRITSISHQHPASTIFLMPWNYRISPQRKKKKTVPKKQTTLTNIII
jgi:hypothetical protein